MLATPQQLAHLRQARLAALASDASLWAEVRAAEAAFQRGEGETFVPDGRDPQGHPPRGGAR